MPENKIRSVKQKPFTPPTTSPTELTTYIGTPPGVYDSDARVLRVVVEFRDSSKPQVRQKGARRSQTRCLNARLELPVCPMQQQK